MSGQDIDITDALTWEEGLPRPQWDLIETWIESRVDPADIDASWSMIARQWLETLASTIGPGYDIVESENQLILLPQSDSQGDLLMNFAERCRQALLAALSDVVNSSMPGKQVVIVCGNRDDYYRYISAYYSEGEHGSSAGIHIREGYPHIVLAGSNLALLENTLAHEMTHAALTVLTLPQWIEEGLAQMFEHDMTSRALLVVNEEMAQAHKKYWGRNGLDPFWRGEGFARSGAVQKLSYELAEILVRLLIEEFRPRWFGWQREPRRKLASFLREANVDDCGEAAATAYLGLALAEIAAWFLGPGEWRVSL